MRRVLFVAMVAALLGACSSGESSTPTAPPGTRRIGVTRTTIFRPEQAEVLTCIEAVESAYLAAEQRHQPNVEQLHATCALTGDAYGTGVAGRRQQESIADIGHLIDGLRPTLNLPLQITAADRSAAFSTLQSARILFDLTDR